MNLSRRQVLITLGTLAAAWPLRNWAAATATAPGNFRYIYADDELRGQFKNFLINVFHLYPEDLLHEAIRRLTAEHTADESIYLELQEELDAIEPFLSELTYALPALGKQKKVMALQTRDLIASGDRLEGYLEIGTNGRYADSLEEVLRLRGPRYYVAPTAPTYSLVDILDRGQIAKGAKFIALDDYRMDLSAIAPNSLDLVTVYIGFHHCPIPLREDFFGKIRNVMSPGGKLIVRDHDAHDENMLHMVALAHDVFNMGTRETWRFNELERRHFYPLVQLDRMLTTAGFKTDGRRLLQDGDPTLNTLMLYQKA